MLFRHRSILRAVTPLLLAACGVATLAGQPEHSTVERQVELSEGWQFRQGTGKTAAAEPAWLAAHVPGDVHLDLLAHHLIPDPFYRENEAAVQWVEAAPWQYRTTLNLTAAQLASPHLELVFIGLDTNAKVLVNGQVALTADNMFRRWRVDLKPWAHAGANELQIDFQPQTQAAEAAVKADPAEADLHIPAKSYLRRAGYEYGWDWGPRLVTSGIWRPALLDTWSAARIDDVYVQQMDVRPEVAHLSVQVRVEADHDGSAKLTLQYGAATTAPASIEQPVMLHAGTNVVTVPLTIDRPALWYPAGYGAQAMYRFTAAVTVHDHVESERTVQTGLRSIRLERKADQWGRSFGFVVNGIPVFAKGADVIPFDSFPSRVTEVQYRRILESARDANMNMIRLWGGGYYESDMFYQLCDELGLMVWNDFMYASSWYPGTVEFRQQMEQEAVEQVERLRNHPSMTVWSGNNEVESVLNAFLGGQSEKGRLSIWKTYLTEFSGILPRTVAHLEPDVPYWPSSPSADYEDTSDTFHAGDAHDWSIWHGREPFENYNKRGDRFTSEYGFQSFPEWKTVAAYTAPEDRASIFTPVMLAHQKNNEGNSIIHEYMLRDYAEPKDFASLLYASQVLQAEGVKIGAEHMRRSRPQSMGSLFWQLNDCWPVASWSSIDYYGRWKALMYYARRFYAPVLVSPTLTDGSLQVYAVSDLQQPKQAELRLRLLSFSGKVLHETTKTITLDPLSSKLALSMPLQQISADGVALPEQFAAVELRADGKLLSSNVLYLEPTKQVHLPAANIQVSVTGERSPYTVTLRSPVLARDAYLDLQSLEGTVSDNYLDLLPGEAQTVQITTQQSRSALEQSLRVSSLVDAFGPATPASLTAPAK